ncbi:MAG: LuxR C-terminal-related transcriptional regulator [Cyanobacteria bacterium J06554_6]
MTNLASSDLDVSQLLFDLKRCHELASQFAGWLDTDRIASCVTDGLVETFDCAFARIWLVEADRTALRLVASSGLYTRLDGSFARVPMGAFKVGKIAQHCIPFLSNRLADESWVKDRNWAIENQIHGFAGLPLMVSEQAIGVLAVFSHRPMAPEFLEVLQILSLSVTGALASALNYQQAIRAVPAPAISLSEQMADRLGRQTLSLIGNEQHLPPAISDLLLQMAQQLTQQSCHYCRLVYETDGVALEALLPMVNERAAASFRSTETAAAQLGGHMHFQGSSHQTVSQVRLWLPSQVSPGDSAFINSPLSKREQEVMALMVEGFRDREIAEQLYISERTVKFHAKNMLEKLNVKTRIQAVYHASQQGWLG